jgi:methylated-DNA-protein-cysteine methyltransferase-like protein
MPRTDEAQAFFHDVYSAIQEIPLGKVTSYGHIARLIGTREWTPFLQSPFVRIHSRVLFPRTAWATEIECNLNSQGQMSPHNPNRSLYPSNKKIVHDTHLRLCARNGCFQAEHG